MKKQYIIKKISKQLFNEDTWSQIPSIHIENFPWDKNGYKPKTEGKLCYTEEALKVKFISYDKYIRAENKEFNQPVYKDSCVEFFFKPNPTKDDRYLNFEINAIGTLLLQLDEKTSARTFLKDINPNIFNIKASVNSNNIESYNEDSWTIEYSIPFEFLNKYFKDVEFASGYKIEGNLYKCGDKTKYPHYGCWSKIENENPAFHKPEFFGELIFE